MSLSLSCKSIVVSVSSGDVVQGWMSIDQGERARPRLVALVQTRLFYMSNW